MPNFAIIESNRVVNAIVAESAAIAEQVTGLSALETDGAPWIGWTLVDDEWVRPSPFPSWTLDAAHEWQPPVPMPTEGEWSWDEPTLSWVEVS